MYEIFENLLKKNGVTAYKVAKESGVTQTALSNWKTGKSTPTTKTLQKIADYFGVTIDYLMTGKEEEWEPSLTAKDEKDIKNALDDFKNQLRTDTGIMYDGEPLDEEDQESILAAIEVAERTAILAAKKKFTPKKYRK